MPSPVQNFSRPLRPERYDEAVIEQLPPVKPSKFNRAASTRNVLRKKPPTKHLRQLRISEPSVNEIIGGVCEHESPSVATSLCQLEAPHVLPEIQGSRTSRRHSGHPMPLASHPDTMKFVSAPPEVSLPDLSRVPCFNSYSVTHGLKCGHVVRTLTHEVCGRNCNPVRGRECHGAAANEPFICQACINNLLDKKYEQKRERLVRGVCPTRPFLGTRADSSAETIVKSMENSLEVERAGDERVLIKLGRYSYAANYS